MGFLPDFGCTKFTAEEAEQATSGRGFGLSLGDSPRLGWQGLLNCLCCVHEDSLCEATAGSSADIVNSSAGIVNAVIRVGDFERGGWAIQAQSKDRLGRCRMQRYLNAKNVVRSTEKDGCVAV